MSQDEDRKFLRAAAEAIVATSMNSQIDPTILELLKRIQYASSEVIHTPQSQESTSIEQQLFSGDSLVDPVRSTNLHHFPQFNLNYFDSLDANTADTNPPSTSASTSTLTSTATAAAAVDLNNILSASSINSTSPWSSMQTPPPTTPPSSSEKPFICKDCTLSFRRSSDLRRHQRAHLPVLPHICQQCGKGFARKDALKRHTDTLTCKRNREKMLATTSGDYD